MAEHYRVRPKSRYKPVLDALDEMPVMTVREFEIAGSQRALSNRISEQFGGGESADGREFRTHLLDGKIFVVRLK